MTPGAATTPEPVDLTRLSRADRRRIGRAKGVKIMGRNMPYVKAIHGSYQNYYDIRNQEIQKDIQARHDNPQVRS